jgi:hypothetical protein
MLVEVTLLVVITMLVVVVVVGVFVAEVVDADEAANACGASASLIVRSTPSLPHVVFLLSATMVPSRQRTFGASHRFTPLPLAQVLEKSRLPEKVPSLHSANIPAGLAANVVTARDVGRSSLTPLAVAGIAATARKSDAATRPPRAEGCAFTSA